MEDEPPAELIDAAADASTPAEEVVVPASTGPAPSAASIAARVPPATHALLAEMFKAEISTVRRISRDQLR